MSCEFGVGMSFHKVVLDAMGKGYKRWGTLGQRSGPPQREGFILSGEAQRIWRNREGSQQGGCLRELVLAFAWAQGQVEGGAPSRV
jgi:hypothetical protein